MLEHIRDDLAHGPDIIGRQPMSPEVALLLSLRLMRSGCASKQLDDQVGFGEQTIRNRFRMTLQSVVDHFGARYIASFSPARVRDEARKAALIGFQGNFGSMDCCTVPVAVFKDEEGRYHTGDKKGYTALGVQVVVLSSLYIANLHIGCGAENDINRLVESDIGTRFMEGRYDLIFF